MNENDMDNIFDNIFDGITNNTKDLTLLYVEDNKDAMDAALIILEELFDNILTAQDGEEALDVFNNNKVDIVLSDINMPKMDGILLCEKIRQQNSDVYLILLSAFNDLEYYERALGLNIEGYLIKPLEMIPLFSILDKISVQENLKNELKQNINLLEQYQNAIDQNLIVSKTDINGNITYINDKFIQTYGYSKDEVLGKKHNFLKSNRNKAGIFEEIWDTISKQKKTWIGIIGNKTKDGKISYSKTTISPIFDIDNNLIEYIALRQDVTELIDENI